MVLVKHSLLTIPLYLLSTFRALVYFVEQIKSLAINFLWKDAKQKGICWKKWEDLCLPMGKGGLGFRDLGAMNQALLAKTAWRIYSNPESLISKVLLGKYCCHNKDFWNCKAVSSSS